MNSPALVALRGALDRGIEVTCLLDIHHRKDSAEIVKGELKGARFLGLAKKDNGFPDYKTVDVGFYATKNNGKCAYGRITLSSYYNGVNYEPWKIFNTKTIDCLCE